MKTSFSLLFLLILFCGVQLMAQPIRLHSSTMEDGTFNLGGFMEMTKGEITYIPYRYEVPRPHSNFVSSNGKIYGIADGTAVPGSGFYNHILVEQNDYDQPLLTIDRKALIDHFSEGGFGVSGDTLVFQGAYGHLVYINLSTYERTLLDASTSNVVYSVNLPHRPLVDAGHCYYQLAGDSTLRVYDFKSKTSTTFCVFPSRSISVYGEINRYENNLYFIVSNSSYERWIATANLSTGEFQLIQKLVSGVNQIYPQVGPQIAQLGEFMYMTTNISGTNGHGELYRVNCKTNAVELLHVFSQTLGDPYFGTISFKDKIYSLCGLKNSKAESSLIEYDPVSDTIRIVKTYSGFPKYDEVANCLLVHKGELRVYGSYTGNKKYGRVSTIDVASGEEVAKEPFNSRYFGFGYLKPALWKNKYFDQRDSVIRCYDISAKTLTEFYTISNALGMDQFVEPEVVGDKLYGISNRFDGNRITFLFSLDLKTKEYKELTALTLGTGKMDMQYLDGSLFCFSYTPVRIIKIDLNTLDTASVLLPKEYGNYYIGEMTVWGDELILSTNYKFGKYKGSLLRLNSKNLTVKLDEKFELHPDTVFHSTMVKVSSKLYGESKDAENVSYLFSYDLKSGDYKSVIRFDSGTYVSNLNSTGNVVFGTLTVRQNDRQIVFTYDLTRSRLYTQEIDEHCDLYSFLNYVITPDAIEDAKVYTNSIFPNPTTEQSILRFDRAFQGSVEVLDITGKLVRRIMVSSESNEVSIDLHGISIGTYIINAINTSGEVERSEKLVVG